MLRFTRNEAYRISYSRTFHLPYTRTHMHTGICSGSSKFQAFTILSVIFGVCFSMEILIALKMHSYAISKPGFNDFAMTCVILKEQKNLMTTEHYKSVQKNFLRTLSGDVQFIFPLSCFFCRSYVRSRPALRIEALICF